MDYWWAGCISICREPAARTPRSHFWRPIPHAIGAGQSAHPAAGAGAGEYRARQTRSGLLSLRVPVQRHRETCPVQKAMVDAGEIFHPLRCDAAGSFAALRDVRTWRRRAGGSHAGGVAGQSSVAPRVTGAVGAKAAVGAGQNALLDFRMKSRSTGNRLHPPNPRTCWRRRMASRLVRGVDSNSIASTCKA